MNKKSLKDLAWNVSEEEYREHPAISYSMLSTYEREGPKCIPFLKDKKHSEAMRFGSLVDTILTEPEEIENKFLVADITKPSEVIATIVTNIYQICDKTTNDLTQINKDLILEQIKSANYYNNLKDDTRIGYILNQGKDYFALLALSEGKYLITQEEYNDGLSCVEVLKTHEFTNSYFEENDYFGKKEGHYQLKFLIDLPNFVNVRCMFDRILVNHEDKTITPCDLKTTGKDESSFESSFLNWNYWIQSNMYSMILQYIISSDDYFRNFTILPFEFIVINRRNKTPMVWTDPNNLKRGDRIDNYGNTHKYWQKLYDEMKWHMRTGIYTYTKEAYDNKGVQTLQNIKIV